MASLATLRARASKWQVPGLFCAKARQRQLSSITARRASSVVTASAPLASESISNEMRLRSMFGSLRICSRSPLKPAAILSIQNFLNFSLSCCWAACSSGELASCGKNDGAERLGGGGEGVRESLLWGLDVDMSAGVISTSRCKLVPVAFGAKASSDEDEEVEESEVASESDSESATAGGAACTFLGVPFKLESESESELDSDEEETSFLLFRFRCP